jgi:predicted alpha/beta superfamily hydrolase
LVYFEHIAPLILVGINYRFEGKSFYEGLKDYLYIRSKDYTPTYLTREETMRKHQEIAPALIAEFIPRSGGAEKFYDFLREELLPFIESEYRAETRNRGLMGYSLGGLFACYTLFKDPKIFERVFIGSPFLRWDDDIVFKFYEESKFKALHDPVTVYLSVGELETQTFQRSWEKLRDLLEQCPNLILKAEKLDGEYHVTGLGSAYSRAFLRLYEKTYGGTLI